VNINSNEFKEALFGEMARRYGSPFAVRVYSYDGKPRETKGFETFEEAKHHIADVVGCDLYADRIELAKDGEVVSKVDCWELRDKALVDGYEFPVHKHFWKENEGMYVNQWIKEQREKALA